MSVSDGERLARLGLARVAEPGSLAVHAALQAFPAEEVWDAVQAGAPLDQLGQRALAGMRVRAETCDPRRDLERLGDVGGRVVCPGDDEWPDGLDWHPHVMSGDVKEMAPPWVLLALGAHRLRPALELSVAIVGARAASPYGSQVAKELAFALAESGVAVVSGGAYGIDAAAHRGALAADAAPTVAVLACGPDISYPRGNDRLLAEIAEKGAVVSEVPPGSAPTRMRFLVRNRIVAAMTRGTIVVEAARRSGSLSTAGRAAELSRLLMAVPGPVTSEVSAGSNALIKDRKAELVTGAAEVLELLGRSGEHLAALVRGPERPRDGLREDARRVLDAVPVRSAVGVSRIARTAGVSALVVQMVLPELLVAGLVEQREGGWRLTTLGASG
ncbi:MAG: DNA-processing protein DprA [Mycobacteriales bacterium]